MKVTNLLRLTFFLLATVSPLWAQTKGGNPVAEQQLKEALAHNEQGVAYMKTAHYREAVEAFRQAVRVKPDFAVGYNNLGVTYNVLGQYPEAIEALKQALRIAPDYVEAHYDLGVAYANARRYREADAPYYKASSRHTNNPPKPTQCPAASPQPQRCR